LIEIYTLLTLFMSLNELRNLIDDYYRNNRNSLIYFHERNEYSTPLHNHIRILMYDINLENDLFRLHTMLLNRTQQIDNEIRNFNNLYNGNINMMNIDPNNNWVALYNSTINLLRIIYVYMGLMLFDFAQINLNNIVIDDINNQLGINEIINNIPNPENIQIINNQLNENIANNIIDYNEEIINN